ncbi:MAG: hypothetical protein U0M02_03585 [Acutalibacteraceae bacterium]|nr:hypothetical protein [Acutalibacteraceae bacterium]
MTKEEFCKLLDTLSDEGLEAFRQYLETVVEEYQKGVKANES